MAMQVGMGLSRVILLVGAGICSDSPLSLPLHTYSSSSSLSSPPSSSLIRFEYFVPQSEGFRARSLLSRGYGFDRAPQRSIL